MLLSTACCYATAKLSQHPVHSCGAGHSGSEQLQMPPGSLSRPPLHSTVTRWPEQRPVTADAGLLRGRARLQAYAAAAVPGGDHGAGPVQGPLRQLPITAGAQPPQQLVQQGTLLPSFIAAVYRPGPGVLSAVSHAVGVPAKLLAALAVMVRLSCRAATMQVLATRPGRL